MPKFFVTTKGVHPTTWYTGKGSFRMTMPWATKATISASKEGFITESIVMVTGPPMRTGYVKEIQFLLQPIHDQEQEPSTGTSNMISQEEAIKGKPELGKKIDLRPIYFVQSKAVVIPDSYKEIDRLADYLHRHPNIYIRISGHTDNQGDKLALHKLSEERANAIKDYLVYQKYVKPLRIETIGHLVAANRSIIMLQKHYVSKTEG